MLRFWLLIVALWWSSTLLANEIRYVGVNVANVRNQPNGAKIGQLKRGVQLTISTAQDGWVRIIDAEASNRWIAEKLLCGEPGCEVRPVTVVRTVNPGYTTPRATPSFYGGGYVSECPCSGSHNCTGRRGGQFCITSGGNKRYR